MDEYVEHVRRLAIHYKDKIRVLVGVEIDASPERTEDLAYLPVSQLNKMDFLLFEYVQDEEAGGSSVAEVPGMGVPWSAVPGRIHARMVKSIMTMDVIAKDDGLCAPMLFPIPAGWFASFRFVNTVIIAPFPAKRARFANAGAGLTRGTVLHAHSRFRSRLQRGKRRQTRLLPFSQRYEFILQYSLNPRDW
jgi:hypothetical protein